MVQIASLLVFNDLGLSKALGPAALLVLLFACWQYDVAEGFRVPFWAVSAPPLCGEGGAYFSDRKQRLPELRDRPTADVQRETRASVSE